jgi:signal transduction histidine kinase/ligand-binding sensor domain-containing protein/DNA-binding response OmpR family regulator
MITCQTLYARIILLIVILFPIFSSSKAQSSLKFKHFNYESGLSSNVIKDIIQDEDGFMWIGTDNGLNRFDGYTFKSYTSISGDSTSLNNNMISAITEDTLRNCLWILTLTGVSKLDKTTYTFKNYALNDSRTYFVPFANGSICLDLDNNLWLEGFSAGRKKSLYKYDADNDIFENYIGKIKDLPRDFTSIFTDRNNKLYFETKQGLFYYDQQNNTAKRIVFESLKPNEQQISCTYVDEQNNIWLTCRKDYRIYKCIHDTITEFYNPNIIPIEYNTISTLTKYNNKIIAGIRDLGILILDLNTKETQLLKPDKYNETGINSKVPLVTYNDKLGNLWIGSYNNGINFLDKNEKHFNHFHFNFDPKGLMSNQVRALFQDSDGEIWIGTKEEGGISRFHPKEGTFDNYKADKTKKNWLSNDIVISINELSPGKLLVGTYGSGIFLYDKKKNIFSPFANTEMGTNTISQNLVYAIYKDQEGLIWIGNNSQVDIFNPTTQNYTHLNGITHARCFADLGDSLIIGTWSSGAFCYHKKDKTIHQFNFKNISNVSDKELLINAITQDLDGTLWFATNKGLIKQGSSPQNCELINKEDHLAEDIVCAVLVDDNNNIWVSTKGGISKLDSKTGTIKNYDKYDGLQSSRFENFVSLKTNTGHLLFAGLNGFNIFHPDSIKDNLNIPNVLITDLYVLNKAVEIGDKSNILSQHIGLTDKITLKHNQSSFSLEFVGINYTSPENNQYQYKLEGFDNEWIDAGTRRTASYTYMPAGEYTFRVKASNNDGVWNTEGASINITVLPTFWKSKTALVIYFVVLFLFLLLLKAIITYRTRQENKLQQEQTQKKRIEQEGKSRLMFFTNISHELRTPLTLITAPLERLTLYQTEDKLLKTQLLSMNRNAQRLLRLVNQLMDFRRMEENKIKLAVSQGDIITEAKEIFNSFKYIAQKKEINLIFITPHSTTIECWYDADILEKSLYNLLSNAIKFTEKNGEITLEIKITDEQLSIQVKDTGVGIPKEAIDKIFDRYYTTDHPDQNQSGTGIGLAFTKNMIHLHHGSIEVESTEKKGSCFIIRFPIDKSSYSENEIQHVKIKSPLLIDSTIELPHQPISHTTSAANTKTIMIVEDYDDLRDYLIQHFNEYNVIACANGKEALEQAKDKMPDIILSDIMMPEMNGLELCHQIKTNLITSHIPVILLTARTTNDQKLEGYKHLADAYIEKPFSIELLKAQVTNLIQLRENITKNYNKDTNTTEPKKITAKQNPLDKIFLDKIDNIIEVNMMDNELSVERISADIGMSRSQLFRKFKAIIDTTPSQYIRIYRLNKASELLMSQQYNVNEVAFMVGFADVSHFISAFKKQFKQTPKQYAENC